MRRIPIPAEASEEQIASLMADDDILSLAEGYNRRYLSWEEVYYRTLWKRFFETVAIRERENPRCQNTFMPGRYRGTMTEFLSADSRGGDGPPPPAMPPATPHGGAQVLATPSGSPAGAPVPGAPTGRSAPATRPGSAPSAPASAP